MTARPAAILIVADASPLIALARGGDLGRLTAAALRIVVPDVVHHEVLRGLAGMGTGGIIAWMRRDRATVAIEPTATYVAFHALDPADPSGDPRAAGREAAREILEARLGADPDLHAILLLGNADPRDGAPSPPLPDGTRTWTLADLRGGEGRRDD